MKPLEINSLYEGLSVVDLTHTIESGMPCYPGTQPPELTDACTLESHGFAEKQVVFHSHTGTHMDAPAHLIEGGRVLDDYEVGWFVGSGIVLDLTGLQGTEIRIQDLEPFQPRIKGRGFVLLYTGRSRAWGEAAYFDGYPVLTPEAAEWLAGFGPKGVGVDLISVDTMDTDTFAVHHILLGRGMVIIENLAHLDALVGRAFLFCCLPLKIKRADGSPVRAVALVTERGVSSESGA